MDELEREKTIFSLRLQRGVKNSIEIVERFSGRESSLEIQFNITTQDTHIQLTRAN